MRSIVTTIVMAFIGGLFTAGLVLAAGEPPAGISSQTAEGQQQYGTATQTAQPQQQGVALPLDGNQISALQKALNEKGFAVGAVDGIVGPKTTGAIRNFQRQEGLAATGQPDQQTIKALGIEINQQEYMGVSPEFGEERPEQLPMKPTEPTEPMPMQPMEQQPQSPGTTE